MKNFLRPKRVENQPVSGKAAGDVRERDVGDAGVEHLHECGQHDGDGDQPWIYLLRRARVFRGA